MRLLIYLLALISGFSAAEAARAEVAPASSVAQAAVAAAEALASEDRQVASHPASDGDAHARFFVVPKALLTPVAFTPVSRHDTIRE